MMRGLLYKEFCMFKPQFKSWIFAITILTVYGFILKSLTILLSMTAFMGVISSLTTFSYDKTFRCDEYVAAMPLSRREIVVSKYLFLFIVDLVLTLGTGILVAIISPFFNEDLWNVMSISLGILGATMFLQAVVLPVIYIWGPEKARFVFVIIGITPYMVLMLFKDSLVNSNLQFLIGLLKATPFILLVVVGISVWVSIRIYERKDL